MQKRCLGSTNLQVSPLGLGTVKFGRNQGVRYPEAFVLPSDQEILNLLAMAYDLGINFLDTAPAYGSSEERIGRLVKNNQDWVIATKVGEEFYHNQSYFDFSKMAITASIERSLRNLHRDYLDLVLVHSDGNDLCRINEDEVFATLACLKQAGKIRAYGMSCKTLEGGLLTIDQADVAMVMYRPDIVDDQEIIRYAYQKHKGILIKKALASGHIDKLSGVDPITETLRFIFAEPGVSSIILGTVNPLHLQQNVASAQAALSA